MKPEKRGITINSLRLKILATSVDPLTRSEALKTALTLISSNRPQQVLTLNSLYVLDADSHPDLANICEKSSLVVADSSGIPWAVRILHGKKIEKISGIDFSWALAGLAETHQIPLFLFGGKPGVAERAKNFLLENFPRLIVAGIASGYFDKEQEVDTIRRIHLSQAKITFVALGMPKQERWISAHLKSLPPGVYIGVGGTLDVWAGHLKRAPSLLQDWGGEWAFRLLQEPHRWSRILKLPWFACKIFLKKILDK